MFGEYVCPLKITLPYTEPTLWHIYARALGPCMPSVIPGIRPYARCHQLVARIPGSQELPAGNQNHCSSGARSIFRQMQPMLRRRHRCLPMPPESCQNAWHNFLRLLSFRGKLFRECLISILPRLISRTRQCARTHAEERRWHGGARHIPDTCPPLHAGTKSCAQRNYVNNS
eukprot:COSAG03_NODE_3799_length_1824_cov_8.102029_2_plen_172_part_00